MDQPFLRIPPFPGHRAAPLALAGACEPLDDSTAHRLAELLRETRVGGSYWAAHPPLRDGRDILLAPSSPHQAGAMIAAAHAEGLLDRCTVLTSGSAALDRSRQKVPVLAGPADPWHLVQATSLVWADADHELGFVAALADRPFRLWGEGRFAECAISDEGLLRTVKQVLGGWIYRCPFTGEVISPFDAIKFLSGWRTLIDGNRSLAAVFGVAAWKRPTVDPLLWDGSTRPLHTDHLPGTETARPQAIIWKSRTPASLLDQLGQSRFRLAELEDGMIRGPGLGANCIPPLSVVVDFSGIYFDPSQPSDLERILESANMDDELVNRAAQLRAQIVAAGISKYGGEVAPPRTETGERQILVVGQVEDDRSILSGGGGQTNLELLERTRALEPDAWLVYRPHPDVEAGHRVGHVPDDVALRYADEIKRDGSIVSLIEAVDEVHCITSLAGFEALLREKPVTTHGVPFYGGWGLTRDLGEVPGRRTRRRSLDELVAATLILYPRYLDPVTRLPCQPEIIVDRMARGEARVPAPLSGIRMLQGKLKIALRRLRKAAA